jgi:thioredoxin reductase
LNGVVINGDLVSYLAKTITGSKTATGSAASFKASTASTYGSIAINKKEGEDTAKVQVSETKSYNVSLVSAKDETTKEETGEIALVVANPDTNTNSLSLNATATDEGKYTVTDLTVGDTTASGTYAADVTEDANGTQTIELTSATNANNKFKITYSEESGDFTYTAPQEYLDKYGLEASK